MLFNLDSSKSTKEVIFSKEVQIYLIISLNNNNIQVEKMSYHKHLGIILDEKLIFKQHIGCSISKINKGISVIKKFRHSLPIDYGDIIYDQPENECFCEKLKSVQ